MKCSGSFFSASLIRKGIDYMLTKAYQELSNAVVELAASDYMDALVAQHMLGGCGEIKKLERFFTGKDISLYTQLDGYDLMRRIRLMVVNCNYDIKTIRRMRGIGLYENGGGYYKRKKDIKTA